MSEIIQKAASSFRQKCDSLGLTPCDTYLFDEQCCSKIIARCGGKIDKIPLTNFVCSGSFTSWLEQDIVEPGTKFLICCFRVDPFDIFAWLGTYIAKEKFNASDRDSIPLGEEFSRTFLMPDEAFDKVLFSHIAANSTDGGVDARAAAKEFGVPEEQFVQRCKERFHLHA